MTADIRHLLPEGQYQEHQKTLEIVTSLITTFIHAYWFDYGSLGKVKKQLEEALGGVHSHFNNGDKEAHLIIYLSDRDDFCLSLPKSEAGCLQMQDRFENALKRIKSGKISISDWAMHSKHGSAVHGLCQILHHLSRKKKEDVFLADRFAVLALAKGSEETIETKSLEELIVLAERRLAEQKDRWSRRALGMLGIQRTRNFLHADRGEDCSREDIITLKASLPESVKQRKHNRLENIVDFPGCKALNLRVRKISEDDWGQMNLHTDAWRSHLLVELKPGPYPHRRNR